MTCHVRADVTKAPISVWRSKGGYITYKGASSSVESVEAPHDVLRVSRELRERLDVADHALRRRKAGDDVGCGRKGLHSGSGRECGGDDGEELELHDG